MISCSIAEVPGIDKSDLELQVKGRTVRLAGTKTVKYPEKASLHRRERSTGRFDRSLTLPVEVGRWTASKAECPRWNPGAVFAAS